MRILQILPELNVGGVETGTVDLAKYLVEHGHDAIVVSNGGPLVKDLESFGARHYQLAVHKKSLWTMRCMIKPLREIILKEKVDIVHARSRVPAWIAYFACFRTPAQFLTTCHGYYSSSFFSRVMGWGKQVIVPSEAIGRHMIEDFKVPLENIRCIPRSVDLTKFQKTREDKPGKSSFTIAIVGRITPLKGHEYFLRAMAKVVRTMPYVKIWIIGDAPARKEFYRRDLEVLVERLGLKDHVEFLGNRSDIPDLLTQIDLLVFSSVVPEAFGRVILEAQAAGVPVVATRVGGVVDIIDDEKTGLLVPPKDPEMMANAIVRVLQDKNLVRQFVQLAREKIEQKFTLEHMAGQTIKVYEEVLRSPNILVIKMTSLGDVILVTASLKALRKRYPEAKIYCLVGKESRSILQRCPYLDGLIVVDVKGEDRSWWRLWKLSEKLRSYRFDKVIDFQNNARSHVLSFLTL
ncbi:MAG: GT4 family glycosyltransferase PelF, partial [Candidatus Omnitrophica bacterium]|nr:GT4 family glycosyltransferase PelF [Candidatus Omnitrophota bacterium]